MKKIEVPIGTRFGKWTTISEKYKIEDRNHYYLDVICDCGKTLTIFSGLLTSGKATRCRECYNGTRPTILTPRDVVINAVYGSYAKSAKKRELEFKLSKEEFSAMLFSECFYCGTSPKNKLRDRVVHKRELPRYNGVDRRNNSMGYCTENVVTCCRWCNEAKKAKTEEEFMAWIRGMANCILS